MPDISVSDDYLHISLRGWDRVWSLRKSFSVPLKHIESARIDADARSLVGWRGAGTGTCHFAAGTFFTRGNKQFVYWNMKKDVALVVQLRGERFHRLILGVPGSTSDAEALVARISQR